MNYQEQLNTIAKQLYDIWRNAPEGADVFEAMGAHSIKKMAEAVIQYAYDGDMKAYKRNEANGGYVTNYLKEQGLIPDQEPPKESAFEKAIGEPQFMVVYKDNEAGKEVRIGPLSPTELLTLDHDTILENHFRCDCKPVGETNVVECNCDDVYWNLIFDRVEETGKDEK